MGAWCFNTFSAYGSEEDLKTLKSSIKGEDDTGREIPFCLNSIRPVPDRFIRADKYRDDLVEAANKSPQDKDNLYRRARKFNRLPGSADKSNCWVWKGKNWGPREEPLCETFQVTVDDEDFWEIEFSTHRDAPVRLMKTLSLGNPEIEMTLTTTTDGNMFDLVTYKRGVCTEKTRFCEEDYSDVEKDLECEETIIRGNFTD